MTGRRLHRRLRVWLLGVGGLLLLYLGSALAVFDFTSAALPYDEENTADGQPVALGPRPRDLFCRPTRYDVAWVGDEWVFAVYRPVCAVWRWCAGYAPPAEWR